MRRTPSSEAQQVRVIRPPTPVSVPATRLVHDRVHSAALVRPPNAWRFSASYEERAQAYKSVKAVTQASASSEKGPHSYFLEKNLTTDTHAAPKFGNMGAVKYYPRAPPSSPRELKEIRQTPWDPQSSERFICSTNGREGSSSFYNPYGDNGSVHDHMASGDAQPQVYVSQSKQSKQSTAAYDYDSGPSHHPSGNIWSKIPSRIVEYSRHHEYDWDQEERERFLKNVGVRVSTPLPRPQPRVIHQDYKYKYAHGHGLGGQGYAKFACKK